MKRGFLHIVIGISLVFAGCNGEPISPKIDPASVQNVGIYDKQTGQFVILEDRSQITEIIKDYNQAEISRDQSLEVKSSQGIKVVLTNGREYFIWWGVDGTKVRIKFPNGKSVIAKGSLGDFVKTIAIPKGSLLKDNTRVKSLGIFRPRYGTEKLVSGFNLPLEKEYLKQVEGKIKPILPPKEKLESSGLYLNYYEDKFTFLELYLDKGVLRNTQTNRYYQLPKEIANGLINYYGVANIRESILIYQNNVYQAVNVALLGKPQFLEPISILNQTSYFKKKGAEPNVPDIYFLHSKDSGKKGFYLYGVYVLYQPRGWAGEK